MVMRGPAPASKCPRCGAEAPPTDEPLAHCAECKLAFDPDAEHPPRPPRPIREERELIPAPRGISIAREPGEVTIRWSYDRLKGVFALVLGVVCAAMFLGNVGTPGEDPKTMSLLAGAALGLLYIGASFAFGELVLRIDERQLLLRREPLRFRRAIWIGRHEIGRIAVGNPERPGDPNVYLVVETPRGWIQLGVFDAGNATQAAAMKCIKAVIDEALAEIPAA